jgi:serine/threonine-protein kinase Stk1
MTQLMPLLDDLMVGEEHAENLTYFAFAKSHKAEPALAPTQVSVGKMPDVLAGRYRIERLLGAGGMGAVYRARDLLSEQFGDPDPYIALKILSEEFADSPDASALLFSEFVLTRRLRHNNVLRLHSFEVDTDCQRAFITMEFMRGLTLDKLLCERPLGLPWKELRDIAVPLLDALAYAHSTRRAARRRKTEQRDAQRRRRAPVRLRAGPGRGGNSARSSAPEPQPLQRLDPGLCRARTARRPTVVGPR